MGGKIVKTSDGLKLGVGQTGETGNRISVSVVPFREIGTWGKPVLKVWM